METGEILTIVKILYKETGWHWPKILISAIVLATKIYKKSSWQKKDGEVAQLIKRLAFIPAHYIKLSRVYGEEKGREITQKIVTVTSIKEMEKFLPKKKYSQKAIFKPDEKASKI